jgi:hypothetical protein
MTLVVQPQVSSGFRGRTEAEDEAATKEEEEPASPRRWKASWRRCIAPSAMAEPTKAAAAKMEPFIMEDERELAAKKGKPAERVKRWSVRKERGLRREKKESRGSGHARPFVRLGSEQSECQRRGGAH